MPSPGTPPGTPPDARVRKDPQGLYDELVERHAARVWRMAFRLTGDHDDANDLSQEAFYEAWRSIRSLRDPGAGGAWLIRILVHRASRRLRRIRTQPPEERRVDDLIDADTGTPDLELLAHREDIQRALDALDPDRRTVFLLVFLEGFTCREAGEMLDIPLGTVLSRIHRARGELRGLLRHLACGIDPLDAEAGGEDRGAQRSTGGPA